MNLILGYVEPPQHAAYGSLCVLASSRRVFDIHRIVFHETAFVTVGDTDPHQWPFFFVEIAQAHIHDAFHFQLSGNMVSPRRIPHYIMPGIIGADIKIHPTEVVRPELPASRLVEHDRLHTVLFRLFFQPRTSRNVQVKKVESRIRNLHIIYFVFGCQPVILLPVPFFFGQQVDAPPRKTVENIRRQGYGIRDAGSRLLPELLRQVVKYGFEIKRFFFAGPVFPPGVQTQYVLPFKAKVSVHHPRQLALHAQRDEQQESRRETLHHQQPSVGTTCGSLSAQRKPVGPAHLVYGITRPGHHQHEHSPHDLGETDIHMRKIAGHLAFVRQPLQSHAAQQNARQGNGHDLRQHPNGILPRRRS